MDLVKSFLLIQWNQFVTSLVDHRVVQTSTFLIANKLSKVCDWFCLLILVFKDSVRHLDAQMKAVSWMNKNIKSKISQSIICNFYFRMFLIINTLKFKWNGSILPILFICKKINKPEHMFLWMNIYTCEHSGNSVTKCSICGHIYLLYELFSPITQDSLASTHWSSYEKVNQTKRP